MGRTSRRGDLSCFSAVPCCPRGGAVMMEPIASSRSYRSLRSGGSMRIGKLQILGTLGTGAHSTILHVRRSEDSTNYALKVVPIGGPADTKYLEQAQHEFRVAQMLDHPNLIKVYAL